jgi:hypothetical protein
VENVATGLVEDARFNLKVEPPFLVLGGVVIANWDGFDKYLKYENSRQEKEPEEALGDLAVSPKLRSKIWVRGVREFIAKQFLVLKSMVENRLQIHGAVATGVLQRGEIKSPMLAQAFE